MRLPIVITGMLLLAASSCQGDRGGSDPPSQTGDVRESPSSPPPSITSNKPQSLTARGIGDTQAQLTWRAPSDHKVFTYRVYRSFYSGVEPRQSELDTLVASGLPQPSFLDTGLAPGYSYYYIVTADDGSGVERPPSDEASCRTTGVATGSPPPADAVWAVANPNGSVDVYWTTGIEGTTRYNVYRSDEESFAANRSTLLAERVRGDHHHDFPPSSKTIWFYQVAAIDQTGKITFPSPQFSVQTGGYDYGPAPKHR